MHLYTSETHIAVTTLEQFVSSPARMRNHGRQADRCQGEVCRSAHQAPARRPFMLSQVSTWERRIGSPAGRMWRRLRELVLSPPAVGPTSPFRIRQIRWRGLFPLRRGGRRAGEYRPRKRCTRSLSPDHGDFRRVESGGVGPRGCPGNLRREGLEERWPREGHGPASWLTRWPLVVLITS